jgi:hypothetical protein
MLASTVQFSNNDQPPVTHHTHDASPGPAHQRTQTQSPHPQTPNNVPDQPDPPPRSTLRRAVLTRRKPNQPNSQRSTHEQTTVEHTPTKWPWIPKRNLEAP